MIVRSLKDVKEAGNEVVSDGWISRRYLLKKDGMGFSFHETIIKAGAELTMWYKNHLEAVYCVKGKGEITDLQTGKKYSIEPGVMYALNLHDRHVLEGKTELTLMCVFNPPVTGREVHDEEGSYRISED